MNFHYRPRNRSRKRWGCSSKQDNTCDPGFCVCPACGLRQPHQPGLPCREIRCPQCGTFMRRAFGSPVSEGPM
jgi:hypothetical protein